LLPHVVVHFHIEHIRDQVQSILVVLDFCVQASQVETIREVVLVDFAEVLVATRGNELREHVRIRPEGRLPSIRYDM
jgi:hypothetical protein